MITSAQHLFAALRFDFWNRKLDYSRDVDEHGSSARNTLRIHLSTHSGPHSWLAHRQKLTAPPRVLACTTAISLMQPLWCNVRLISPIPRPPAMHSRCTYGGCQGPRAVVRILTRVWHLS